MSETKNYWWKNHAVTHCPNCMVKMRTRDTRPFFKLGYPSNRRRKICRACNFTTITVEIPMDLGIQNITLLKEENTDV